MKFWTEEPSQLFSSLEIVPTNTMDKNDKLNAVARLIILISLVLYVLGKSYSFLVLICGLLATIVVYNLSKPCKKEGYVFPRQYVNTDYEPLGMPPAEPAGMPTVSQVPTEPINKFINSINAGQVQDYPHPEFYTNNAGEFPHTPVGVLLGRADEFEGDQNYTPFYEDKSGAYKKRIPIGQYLQSQAQQYTSRMNDQMNHIQKEYLYRIQRSMNRHLDNPNGFPEMGGPNVDYPTDDE